MPAIAPDKPLSRRGRRRQFNRVWSFVITNMGRVQDLERDGALTVEEAAKARELLEVIAKAASRRLLDSTNSP